MAKMIFRANVRDETDLIIEDGEVLIAKTLDLGVSFTVYDGNSDALSARITREDAEYLRSFLEAYLKS